MYLHLNIVEIKSAFTNNALWRFLPAPREKNTGEMRHQPCLCLCFGFSQITLILPFLLITLHFSQIGFTEDLTFTVILLSFVVCFPVFSPQNTHQISQLPVGESALRLPYLYKKHLKKGIIQAFQQSSPKHYITFILENQALFPENRI